jgi:hypothetical protein
MDLLNLQSDPVAFRSALLIDTDGGPRPLAECMDDWQDRDFRALDSGWRRAVLGKAATATHQRGWLERPRGHSKSADLGVMCAWALFASRRRLSGIAAAGDQDQARLLRDAIGKLLYINPWLAKVIEVQAYRVINVRTQSTLEIISSDAPTSYGLTPDFCVCDEVTHWPKRDLWDSLISSAAKRSTCMFVVIANAGLQDDWQWQTREAVRSDPGWYFSRLEGPVASWINADLLAEQQRLLPGVAYRRLWLNEWTSGGGDALTEADINAAFIPELEPMTGNERDWLYCAGVDLGLKRDCSAVVVLAVPDGGRAGRIRLANTKMWRPTPGRKIDLREVHQHILALDEQYELEAVAFDPWQMEHLAQVLEADSDHLRRNQRRVFGSEPWLREVTPTASNLRAQASLVIECFTDRRLQLYPQEQLRRDLLKLRVEEKSYGIRLVSPRDATGHGDTFSAFALALLIAHDFAGRRPIIAGGDGSQDGLSPMERALRRVDQQIAEFNAERELMSQPDDGLAELRQLMRMAGRL